MPRKRNNSRKDDRRQSAELPLDCHCFICDEFVKNDGVQIVLGRTPYSNIGLPTKIGQLIGDKFMVVVGVSDTMCNRCASLISRLDKLETDACTVKKTLMGYIAAKYQLDDNEICSQVDQVQKGSESPQKITDCTLKHVHHESVEMTLQESLEVPNESQAEVMHSKCTKCDFFSIDSDALLNHHSLCSKLENKCTECGAQVTFQNSLADDPSNKMFLFTGTCNECPLLGLDSEEAFMKHMATHLASYDKCAVCGFSSLDKDTLNQHLLSHSSHIFCCTKCTATFNHKTELDFHLRSHLRCSKCFSSPGLVFQSNMPDKCGIPMDCLAGNNERNNAQTDSKAKTFSDLMTVMNMESLMKADEFDSDESHIEFHSCPSCGLTFLNKILFSEHVKMHEEHLNQAQVDILDPNTQEETLKCVAVSVAGDCSIDDDLEDLFEKLHAESTSSLAHEPTHCFKSNRASSNNIEGHESSVGQQNTNFHNSSKSEDLTPSASSSLSSSNICQSATNIIASCGESESGKCQETLLEDELDSTMCSMLSGDKLKNSLRPLSILSFDVNCVDKGIRSSSGLRSAVTNIEPNLESNSPVVDGDMSDQNTCQEAIGKIFDSTEPQNFIYISSDGQNLLHCDTQGMVLHNATIDPESGDIHLLPFVMSDTVPASQSQSPALGCEMENSSDHQDLTQTFCQVKLPASELNTVDPAIKDVLSCAFCDFQTSIDLALKKHLKGHQENSIQKCSICNRVFASTRRLLTHLDLRHKGAGPIGCPFCSEEFEHSNFLREHLTQKHPVGKHSFSCRFCQEKFNTKKLCLGHEESHSEVFKFECDRCVKKFTSNDDLDDHVKWEHDKAGQCRYCGKQIDKPKALRNHELRHLQESNHHECHVCQRVFKTKTGLRHHAASHTGQFNYCCDFCGRGFMSRMMLEEHRSCHTKEERYVCDVCGQKFTFQSTYWIHRKWHETPYPYKCNFCGRFFKHSSLLAVHKRKHTGERPYKCPHCPLTFPVSGTLKRHMILHTGVYPFNCDTCRRGFTAKHKYATHLSKVHGIKDFSIQKPLADDVQDALNTIDDGSQNTAKDWGLEDSGLSESGNAFSVQEEGVVGNDGGSLMDEQNLSSRVVEIVLDDSFQTVATVTLAEIAGNQSEIPDSWYE